MYDKLLKPRQSFLTLSNTELNPTCHFLALLGAHPTLHVSRIRVNNPVLWCAARCLSSTCVQPWSKALPHAHICSIEIVLDSVLSHQMVKISASWQTSTRKRITQSNSTFTHFSVGLPPFNSFYRKVTRLYYARKHIIYIWPLYCEIRCRLMLS